MKWFWQLLVNHYTYLMRIYSTHIDKTIIIPTDCAFSGYTQYKQKLEADRFSIINRNYPRENKKTGIWNVHTYNVAIVFLLFILFHFTVKSKIFMQNVALFIDNFPFFSFFFIIICKLLNAIFFIVISFLSSIDLK